MEKKGGGGGSVVRRVVDTRTRWKDGSEGPMEVMEVKDVVEGAGCEADRAECEGHERE